MGSECSRNLYKQQRQKKATMKLSYHLGPIYGGGECPPGKIPNPKKRSHFLTKNSTNFANLAYSNISNILVSPVPKEMVLLLLGLLIASLQD